MNDENTLKIEYKKIGPFNCQYAYFDKSKINKVLLWPGQMGFEKVIKNLSNKTPKKDIIKDNNQSSTFITEKRRDELNKFINFTNQF